ncbi:Uncharacterized protein conserved in bacteria (DUF2330) [Seminavis robusta]|uniref:Uncharacterized protein conserved in bacteria (DUF2330) n=1 Tax=Seminavis robusta TaxID=568900 RepID=A0A9N8DB28_9STRA|nr:Uncharacterized protein conserved in bacteria (DUF2330) [Seminavis robusta]|eukprot:Sro64_g036480.1 Uncharacterized protein conserved in bacteria (DUF2330) (764) ;mRNA; r:117559-119937
MTTHSPCYLSLLLAALLVSSSPVSAFGGFFGRAPPEQDPVAATNNVVVFGVQGSTVTMQIQLDYKNAGGSSGQDELLFGGGSSGATGNDGILFRQGNPTEEAEDEKEEVFAWILPLPAAPLRVETGSTLLMDALQEHTRPSFVLEIHNYTHPSANAANNDISAKSARQFPGMNIPGRPPSFSTLAEDTTCSPEALELNCPIQGPTRGFGGDLLVLEQGTAGVLDYAVLDGQDASQVIQWLQDMEFTLPDDADDFSGLEAALQSYIDQGHVFVAVQLQADEAQGSLQPLLVEYELPATVPATPNLYSIPLSISHASSADMALQVFFLTDVPQGRVVPVNYLDATMDDAYVDWVGCYHAPGGESACYQNDYHMRVHAVVDEIQNHTLVTEYAGPASVLMDKVTVDTDNLADIAQSATWLDFVTTLEQSNVPPNARLQEILLEYIPLNSFRIEPPFQCASLTAVYQPNPEAGPTMEDCYELFEAPAGWTWDPINLAAALTDEIFLPAQAAQAWVDQFEWMTRFLGYIPSSDDGDDIKEPYFTISTEGSAAALVARHHRAEATPVCPEGNGRNPNILEIELMPREKADAANDRQVFWQAARLQCPTWLKSTPGVFWSKNDAFQFTQGQGPLPRPFSYAESFVAHGIGAANAGNSHFVSKNEEDADGVIWDPVDLAAAVAFGDTMFEELMPPVGSVSRTRSGPVKDPDFGFRRALVGKPIKQRSLEQDKMEMNGRLRAHSAAADTNVRTVGSLLALLASSALLAMAWI